MVQKRVDECTTGSTRGGMNNHSRSFINHDAVRVFVEDIERQRFGVKRCVPRRQRAHVYAIVEFKPRARFRRTAVQSNLPFGNQPLDVRAAEVSARPSCGMKISHQE